MVRPLIILGTGGGAYDVLDVIESINSVTPEWSVAGFLDDSRPAGSTHLGFPILGRLPDARHFAREHQFINVIGSDASYRSRPAVIGSTGLPADSFETLIHPAAGVSSRVRLGRGVLICHGVSVAGGTRIDDHASLSAGVIVGHDTSIEPYSLLAPGAIVSGYCRIGRAAYIGAGSVIRQHIQVGAESLVGMGAVVLRHVNAGEVVVGNPARVLRRGGAAPAMTTIARISAVEVVS